MDCFIAYEAMAANGAVSLGVLNTGKTDLDTSASSGGAAWIGATTVSSAGLTARRPGVHEDRVIDGQIARWR